MLRRWSSHSWVQNNAEMVFKMMQKAREVAQQGQSRVRKLLRRLGLLQDGLETSSIRSHLRPWGNHKPAILDKMKILSGQAQLRNPEEYQNHGWMEATGIRSS
jgi:hypothetical protein